jgi:glutathione S-transferase
LGRGIQKAWLNPQLETHARFIESHLADSLVCRRALSMADIQMSFPDFCAAGARRRAIIFRISGLEEKGEQRPAGKGDQQGGPFDLPGAKNDPKCCKLRMDDNVCASAGYFRRHKRNLAKTIKFS